jgi:hypothetical protein
VLPYGFSRKWCYRDLALGKEKGYLAVTYLPSGWSPQVLSALGSFTAVFGMGTGGTTPL